MIQFGETYLSLEDGAGQIAEYVERYHSLSMMRMMATPANTHVKRGSNLLYVNYPDLPAPRINELVIPTGATRWTYFLGLATDSQKDAIEAEYAARSKAAMRFRFSSGRVGADESSFEPLTLFMHLLEPRPLTAQLDGTDEKVSGGATEDLWLIPMVDPRYFWQFKQLPDDLSDAQFSTPQNALDTLTTALNASISFTCLNSVYEAGPNLADNPLENAATALETLAWHTGTQLVPDVAAKDSSGDAITEAKYRLISVDDSPVIHANNLEGKVGIADCTRGDSVTSGNSGFEQCPEPHFLKGGSYEGVGGASLPESVIISFPSGNREHTATEAGVTSETAVGVSSVIRLSYVGDSLPSDEISLQAAKDYYRRFSKLYDYSFSGIQKWQPTGFDDAVILSQVSCPRDGYRVQTRVRGWTTNLRPESLGVVQATTDDPGGDPVEYTCGDCTNCLDVDDEEDLINTGDCSEITGEASVSWWLMWESSLCCSNLQELRVELVHDTSCTWKSEIRECEELWNTDPAYGGDETTRETINSIWAMVVGSTWVTLTLQYYRGEVGSEENIADYVWRIRKDEFSPLCDNRLKLDNTDGLIDGPMNRNEFRTCPPPCELCITPFPIPGTVNLDPCSTTSLFSKRFHNHQFQPGDEFPLPEQLDVELFSGGLTVDSNYCCIPEDFAGTSVFNVESLSSTKKLTARFRPGYGWYSSWHNWGDCRVDYWVTCADGTRTLRYDVTYDMEFRFVMNYRLWGTCGLSYGLEFRVKENGTTSNSGDGPLPNNPCREEAGRLCPFSPEKFNQSSSSLVVSYFTYRRGRSHQYLNEIHTLINTPSPFVFHCGMVNRESRNFVPFQKRITFECFPEWDPVPGTSHELLVITSSHPTVSGYVLRLTERGAE